jgi:hypothetical protein
MLKNTLDKIINGETNNTYLIGGYKYEGDLVKICKIAGPKLESTFCYCMNNHVYLFIKEYISGKVHIDYFYCDEFVDLGLLFNRRIKDKIFLSSTWNGKSLFFDGKNNSYVIEHVADNKKYEVILKKQYTH